MTLHEEQEKVQKAMNTTLSGLQEDPWLARRVLARAKGEEPVKKKMSAVFILIIALALAIIGTAYAMFSSQVAEFFGRHWSKELGESLQEGKIARIGESVTIGDVVFTLDEIVYKDRALYGVGTARPVRENDVFVPWDLANDPEFFAVNEDAQALAVQAKAAGGRLLTTSSVPRKIGVDGGALLIPGCIGYYDLVNEDGSLTFSFEATDGFAVNEGESYQILLESEVLQLNENGEEMKGTATEAEWTVSCVPVVMNTADRQSSAAAAPAVIQRGGYVLTVPAAYQETGTLPVYQARETDFTATADPAWFNQTGIASKEGEEIRFSDHAVLMVSPDGLFYNEYTDDTYTEAASNVIVERAWVRNWPKHRGEFALERTSLYGITLEEAKEKAQEMLARLGIDGNQYVCTEALDMSLERIRALGDIWERAILDGELLVDGGDYQPYDYASIPESEEGYYLKYFPLGVDTHSASERYSAVFYITSRGIVHASIRNPYTRGEIAYTPETLITPDAAVDKLREELGRSLSRYDKVIQSVRQAALTYEAVRADKKDEGMQLIPVWMILYQDDRAAEQDYNCYAFVNAVDGTLIDASFR